MALLGLGKPPYHGTCLHFSLCVDDESDSDMEEEQTTVRNNILPFWGLSQCGVGKSICTCELEGAGATGPE